MSSETENKNKFDKMKENFSKKPKKPFNFYWVYAIIGVILIFIQLFNWSNPLLEMKHHEFEAMVEEGVVKQVVVVNEKVAEVYLNEKGLADEKYAKRIKKPSFGKAADGPQFYFEIGPANEFAREIKELSEKYKGSFKYDFKTVKTYEEWFGWLIPLALVIVFWIIIMRRMGGSGGPGGQIFNIGKSKAQLFDKDAMVKVTFNDVAGLEGSKEEIQEIVDFLKNPQKYTKLGAKIPKGALLVGPPGTGKTLLAKAVAGEAQVPFFSLSGSDFVEMFVGVGASRVRDLFKTAKEKAPCIIFIDEIDAIGRARGKSVSAGANDERENTLNQLLTEMDGFGTNSGVIILAATNRADILDRALLRPGRFDRVIHVDMPDMNEREEIFKVHLKPLKLDDTVDVTFLAKQTPGFSGADIANICNEAALIAARKSKVTVDKQDFLDAVDRIIGGLEKKSKLITPTERKTIAYHEAGHASVSWLLEHASPLVKVTIVPRGNSLGAAWYLPEERSITTKEQMIDELCAALGGRASEEIVFGRISTGALSDLEKVTKQSYAMVAMYGLNEKLGNVSYYDSSGQSEYSFSKPYSEKTAQTIDEEVSKMIEICYDKTKVILNENRDKLDQLAMLLLEKEVIFKEDLETIFGARPFLREEPEIKKRPVIAAEVPVVELAAEITPAATAEETSKPADKVDF